MRTGKERNQALDLLRLIASFMVIVIHAPLPGCIGVLAESISRIAVPLFFMISGYYVFPKSDLQLKEKMRKTELMLLCSVSLYFVWEISWGLFRGTAVWKLQQYFTIFALPEIFLLNTGIWLGHLWFLLALLYCYVLYSLVLRKVSCSTKLAVGIGLLIIHFTLREILRDNGITDTTYYTRNFLFTGLPFFLLGEVVFQERNRIARWGLRMQYCIFVMGLVVGVAERLLWGISDLYLGTVIATASLFILGQDERLYINSRLSEIGRRYAGDIYILHVIVIGIINMAASVTGVLYSYAFLLVRPIVVLWLCMIAAKCKGKLTGVIAGAR